MRLPFVVNDRFTDWDRCWATRIKGMILVEERAGWVRCRDCFGCYDEEFSKTQLWKIVYRTYRAHLIKNIIQAIFIGFHVSVLVWLMVNMPQ